MRYLLLVSILLISGCLDFVSLDYVEIAGYSYPKIYGFEANGLDMTNKIWLVESNVWDDIINEALNNKTILKITHDGGYNKIVKEISIAD